MATAPDLSPMLAVHALGDYLTHVERTASAGTSKQVRHCLRALLAAAAAAHSAPEEELTLDQLLSATELGDLPDYRKYQIGRYSSALSRYWQVPERTVGVPFPAPGRPVGDPLVALRVLAGPTPEGFADPLWARTAAFAHMVAETGLAIGTLARLSVAHLDPAHHVVSAGNREAHLSRPAAAVLDRWLGYREKLARSGVSALWVATEGSQVWLGLPTTERRLLSAWQRVRAVHPELPPRLRALRRVHHSGDSVH